MTKTLSSERGYLAPRHVHVSIGFHVAPANATVCQCDCRAHRCVIWSLEPSHMTEVMPLRFQWAGYGGDPLLPSLPHHALSPVDATCILFSSGVDIGRPAWPAAIGAAAEGPSFDSTLLLVGRDCHRKSFRRDVLWSAPVDDIASSRLLSTPPPREGHSPLPVTAYVGYSIPYHGAALLSKAAAHP
ncbi:hypothetical protein VTJ83DRAFT_4909 [Remersonia thermophila]|uniref:Uncharacterized protein n=1 Tax=Remersonia thermophila TaxID=72144 RepID=A0ABR4DDH6_9PEZI